jgi:hypothetical protein
VTFVDNIWNEEKFNAPLVVVTILHTNHSLFSLVFGLILNKKVTWVCADHFLAQLNKPLMFYTTVRLEPF